MDVLWVENHAPFVRVCGPLFLSEHRVTVVPSLTAARAFLEGTSFDMVLIDFDLDDGKGTELVRELSNVAGRPLLVAVSAHAEGNRALIEAGADAVCGKPEFNRIGEVIAVCKRR
jgi:CheY-like chemotaxis protein